MLRRSIIAACVILVSGAVAAAQTVTLRGLLIRYRCPVVDRLDRIYEFPKPTDFRDRFLAVTLVTHPHGYVQCMFIENRSRVLCEASSGYFFDKPDVPRTFYLAPEAVAALGRLGFSTDSSKGNHRYEAAIGAPPDLNAVADLMLTALHNAYGARAGDMLRFNAPYAPGAVSKCAPMR